MSNFKAFMFLPIFEALGMNAKLRDDDKVIAIDSSVEGFRDADGDEAIYFVAGVPYENLAIITAVSLFNGEGLSETLKKELVKLSGSKCSKCGYDKCLRALQFHHINILNVDSQHS